jgi:hypothetical protein
MSTVQQQIDMMRREERSANVAPSQYVHPQYRQMQGPYSMPEPPQVFNQGPYAYGAGYAPMASPPIYGQMQWGSAVPYYAPPPPMMQQHPHSPSMGSASSFSPQDGGVRFPDSPPQLDASQMLMSPSRFRKRRHLSPLLTSGTVDSMAPQQPLSATLMQRMPVAKVPVMPSSYSAGSSPKNKAASLVLPCFFDQQNRLRTHGPSISAHTGPSAYWDDTRRNVNEFLGEAAKIDAENITIIEIKQLLRRYCINATGKKTVLMDRIKQLQEFLLAQLERERLAMEQANKILPSIKELTDPAVVPEKEAVKEAKDTSDIKPLVDPDYSAESKD